MNPLCSNAFQYTHHHIQAIIEYGQDGAPMLRLLSSDSPMAPLQGVMKALNVNKLTKCGVTFKFW